MFFKINFISLSSKAKISFRGILKGGFLNPWNPPLDTPLTDN